MADPRWLTDRMTKCREFDVCFLKFKMADGIWPTDIVNLGIFMRRCIKGVFGALNSNLMRDFW